MCTIILLYIWKDSGSRFLCGCYVTVVVFLLVTFNNLVLKSVYKCNLFWDKDYNRFVPERIVGYNFSRRWQSVCLRWHGHRYLLRCFNSVLPGTINGTTYFKLGLLFWIVNLIRYLYSSREWYHTSFDTTVFDDPFQFMLSGFSLSPFQKSQFSLLHRCPKVVGHHIWVRQDRVVKEDLVMSFRKHESSGLQFGFHQSNSKSPSDGKKESVLDTTRSLVQVTVFSFTSTSVTVSFRSVQKMSTRVCWPDPFIYVVHSTVVHSYR